MGAVIRSFADQGTEDVFDGVSSKAARSVCPPDQYRVCFYWKDNDADEVEITDYH
jgi:hypothetical protein